MIEFPCCSLRLHQCFQPGFLFTGGIREISVDYFYIIKHYLILIDFGNHIAMKPQCSKKIAIRSYQPEGRTGIELLVGKSFRRRTIDIYLVFIDHKSTGPIWISLGKTGNREE